VTALRPPPHQTANVAAPRPCNSPRVPQRARARGAHARGAAQRDEELEALRHGQRAQSESEAQLRVDVERQLGQLHAAYEEERAARREAEDALRHSGGGGGGGGGALSHAALSETLRIKELEARPPPCASPRLPRGASGVRTVQGSSLITPPPPSPLGARAGAESSGAARCGAHVGAALQDGGGAGTLRPLDRPRVSRRAGALVAPPRAHSCARAPQRDLSELEQTALAAEEAAQARVPPPRPRPRGVARGGGVTWGAGAVFVRSGWTCS